MATSENKSTPNYQSVAVRLKLGGALQNVIKWLVQIQQTGAIPSHHQFFFEKRERAS
jgi:hypothetical protein